MSNLRAEVVLEWADGTYAFRLPLAQLIELEQKCGVGFAAIYHRLVSGAYGVNDVRETIRLGLIGGGTDGVRALALVKAYVDDRPKADAWGVAKVVMGAVMFGFEAAPLGKPTAAATGEPNPSPSPPSIVPQQ